MSPAAGPGLAPWASSGLQRWRPRRQARAPRLAVRRGSGPRWARSAIRTQLGLRAGVLAGTALCLLAAALAGTSVAGWGAALLVVLAIAACAWPDSVLGMLLLLGCAVTWLPVGHLDSPWVLLGAAGLLLVHIGLQLAALGPASSRIDPPLLRLWCVRLVIAWTIGALVWVVSRLLPAPGQHASTYLQIAALLVVAAGATALSAFLLGQRGRSGDPVTRQ